MIVYFVVSVIILNNNCLVKSTHSKSLTIIGGENASILDYPYQVSVEYLGKHKCGGAIINKNVILTAAHCANNNSVNSYSIRAGTDQLENFGQIFPVKEIIRHQLFSPQTADYDISLIILKNHLNFSKSIQPIQLPNFQENIQEKSLVTITGWGSKKENGKFSQNLQKVSIPVVNENLCKNMYSNYNQVTSRMFCAGYLNGGKDSCNGDSGSPVIQNKKLVGLVSWAKGCAKKRYPGVNTKIVYFRSWINFLTGI